MNPTEAATTFATLVGLVCNFRQEKGEREALDHRKFIEWLEYHRHEELKQLIVNTAALRTEVDNLLRSDHALMLQKLDCIGEILVSLLSRLDEFRGLALAVAPNADLSEQAILFLRQFTASDADGLYYSDYGGGQFSLILLGGSGEQMSITEPRFIRDDLDKLTALGLLTVEYNSEGNPIYHITRNAVRFVKALGD